MFEDEEVAANVEETTEETPVEEQPTSPVEQVDQTKAFAKRLREETEKVRQLERENIAKSFGYNSWQEYADAQTNNKLLDKGLDPESVRPVIEDLIRNDPKYMAAIEKAEKYEELEKELFAKDSIKALNDKFGTDYKSINDLDPETIDDWNKGTPLEKAFAANNYSKLIDMAVKKAGSNKDNGKSLMKTVTGGNVQTKTREIVDGELAAFKAFGISEEQAKEYVNRTKK